MDRLRQSFIAPLMISVILSGILGSCIKHQLEYDAVTRLNIIQQQSMLNYDTYKDNKTIAQAND